jgi:TatA/E family protein of Tat protein translocase
MFGLQPLHIVVILALALLIFGPSQLPNIARSLGRSINEFRNSASSMSDELKKGLDEKPAVTEVKTDAPKSDV